MSMTTFTVHDMLKRPHFQQARVIAGVKGLHNPIAWAHILELTKVKHLLNGKECVLTTGIGWGDDLQHSTTFLQQLIERKSTCLCIELGHYIKEVPQTLIDMADTHELPILVFPREVRFIDISKDINRLILDTAKMAPHKESWVTRWLNGSLQDDDALPYLERTLGNQDVTGTVCLMTGYDEGIPYQRDMFQSFFIKEGFEPIVLQDGDLLLFILVDEKDTGTRKLRLKHVVHHLNEKVNSLYNHVGFGNGFNMVNEIPASLRTAQETITIQQTFHKCEPFYENLHPYRLILMDAGTGGLETLVNDYLGEVMAHDREHDSILLETLRVYLQCYGSKKETAEKLFIVRQTLYHRMLKLEEILGENFIHSERRLGLEMAMLGYEYLYG